MKGFNRFQLTILYLLLFWSIAALILYFCASGMEQKYKTLTAEFFLPAGIVLVALHIYFVMWRKN